MSFEAQSAPGARSGLRGVMIEIVPKTSSAPSQVESMTDRLTTEILLYVLLWSVDLQLLHHSFYRWRNTLGLVCKRWREIVERCPTFWPWTTIDIQELRNVPRVLKNAGRDLPLEINAGDDIEREQLKQFLAYVAPQAQRWKVLQIDTVWKALLDPILSTPMPVLEIFDVAFDPTNWHNLEYSGSPTTREIWAVGSTLPMNIAGEYYCCATDQKCC